MKNLLLIIFLISIGVGCNTPPKELRILIFSKTEGYRHESIETGQEAIKQLGIENGFQVDVTEDASIFNEFDLKEYQVLVFLSTTGDILNEAQQFEMQRWVQAGGGFVGIHAAADTEYDWPWYGKLVGAYFKSHPDQQNASIDVEDSTHISCTHLPSRWDRFDEWYNYKSFNGDINVLLNLDESTYQGGENGARHPIAWYHEFDGGKSWYTGGGHTHESFAEPDFMQHILGGIQWVAGDRSGVDYNRPNVAPHENRFNKIVLTDNLNEPMELVMLPDRSILFVERKGDMKLYDPEKDTTFIVAHVGVHTEHEDGLLGIALDPNYATNHWIYLFNSPPGDIPKQHISRFEFRDRTLDKASEKVLLEIPTQRDECCHSGGSLEFGPDGLLYISVGDDTNPFASDGFSPSDERPGRSAWDAQRSSSNTNDLRGKILRIKPETDGTYSIPEGNLFPKDGSEGKPEIYVMGCRNPFRISIDPHSKFLYWGDVGPDAGEDRDNRGPRGHDEVNQARQAGYFGWPLFVGDNKPYYKYDFARKSSGVLNDPAKPINNSPNNSGLKELPPAQPAFIWYPYTNSTEFPLVGEGGRNAMAGPVFYMDDYPDNPNRFPAYYDKKLITYDWMRGWLMAVTMNEQGDFQSMERIMPSHKFSNPTDIIMSPDGDMYLLEYGTIWFNRNQDARLVHLQYISGNRQPVAKIQAPRMAGAAPFTINFSSKGSMDFDGDELAYHWDFGDGGTSNSPNPGHTFQNPGTYEVVLTVKDNRGSEGRASLSILAGNEPPSVAWNMKGNSSFFWPGEKINYEVQVRDREDGTVNNGIDPNAIAVTMEYLSSGFDVTEIAQGHKAMASISKFLAGKTLIEQSDCRACHLNDQPSAGPSYLDVAKKYDGESGARDYLIAKIRDGGSGVWGDTQMSAHPQHSDEEIGSMVDYIMSLAEEEVNKEKLPLSGVLDFQVPTGETEGSYVLMASYTDRGGPNNTPPLDANEVIYLRYPKIDASAFDVLEGVNRFDANEEQTARMGLSGKRTLIIGSHEGYVGYKNIDLTGIRSVGGGIMVAPQFNKGGVITISIDAPDGPIIGMIPVSTEDPGLKDRNVDIKPTDGVHDVYFSFIGNDEGSVGMVVWWTFAKDASVM